MYGTSSAWRPPWSRPLCSSALSPSCASAADGRPRTASAQARRRKEAVIASAPVAVVGAEAAAARAEIGRVEQQLDVGAAREKRQRILERALPGLVGAADHQRLADMAGELGGR